MAKSDSLARKRAPARSAPAQGKAKRVANGAPKPSAKAVAARAGRGRASPRDPPSARVEDEEVASSEDDDEDDDGDEDDERGGLAKRRGPRDRAGGHAGGSTDDDDDDDDDARETLDERRVRMAKAMLTKLERARQATGAEEDDAEEEIERELQKQAAIAAGRHFERVASRLAARPPLHTRVLRGLRRAPTALCLCADDSAAYTGSKDGELVRWDVETGKRTRLTPKAGKKTPIAGLALSADGALLACGGPDQLLHVWDTRSAQCVESFKGHRDGLSALAFGGASKELFTAARDRTVKLWNLSEMAYVETLFGHADEITALDALSGERAVSCGTDRSVRLWKVHEETQLVFHGHSAAIDCVRMLTPSSFVTGSQDGRICLWQASRKKPVATVAGAHGAGPTHGAPCNWISALGVLPYSDVVASGAADGMVRFWRAAADESALEPVHAAAVPGFVNAIEISRASRRFAVAAVGMEHRLGRWFVDTDVRNGIAVVQLPAALSDEPDDQQGSTSDAGEQDDDSDDVAG